MCVVFFLCARVERGKKKRKLVGTEADGRGSAGCGCRFRLSSFSSWLLISLLFGPDLNYSSSKFAGGSGCCCLQRTQAYFTHSLSKSPPPSKQPTDQNRARRHIYTCIYTKTYTPPSPLLSQLASPPQNSNLSTLSPATYILSIYLPFFFYLSTSSPPQPPKQGLSLSYLRRHAERVLADGPRHPLFGIMAQEEFYTLFMAPRVGRCVWFCFMIL